MKSFIRSQDVWKLVQEGFVALQNTTGYLVA